MRAASFFFFFFLAKRQGACLSSFPIPPLTLLLFRDLSPDRPRLEGDEARPPLLLERRPPGSGSIRLLLAPPPEALVHGCSPRPKPLLCMGLSIGEPSLALLGVPPAFKRRILPSSCRCTSSTLLMISISSSQYLPRICTHGHSRREPSSISPAFFHPPSARAEQLLASSRPSGHQDLRPVSSSGHRRER